MILIYGRRDDPPTCAAVEAAQDLEQPVIWLDQCALDRSNLLLSVTSDGASSQLIVAGCTVQVEGISGIYARPLGLPKNWPDALARARAEKFHELFLEWLEMSPTLVVNRPSDMDSNGSKPYQAQLIGAAGFNVPETIVTSNPEEAREFWQEHKRVIFKSISGVRSIVTELSEAHTERLNRLRDLPVQLQAFVPGIDVRVHVVGRTVFACSVESAATDYRYAHQAGGSATLATMDLPTCIADRCVELAERLRLPFCGLDFRLTSDGRWTCFEVNPMPAYTYFENQTGLPISQTLISLLANGKRASVEHANGSGHR